MTTIDRRDLIRGTFATSILGVTAAAIGAAPSAQAAPNDPVTRSNVINRAQNWVNRNIQYSQAGTATGPDGVYTWRRDCSGYVSMALKLGPTGIGCPNTTALAGSTYSVSITKASLKAGDYLVDSGVHVVMFHKWANAAKTRFWLYEQSNPSSDMNHREAALSTYSGFAARRARNIRD